MSVSVSFNQNRTRGAFRFSHPTGNIITSDIIAALRAGLESAAQNPHLKLITIEGDGQDFSFGASIQEHTASEIARVLPEMHALIDELLDAPAVTAAIVRGRCLGGGFELALACDAIFAADSASFGLPEIGLGVFPPAASALLPARIGTARSMVPILTGESRSAAEWQADGLIHAVAPAADLGAFVDRWFERHVAPRSAVGLRHAAIAARSTLAAQVRATLPALERLYLTDLMRTHDASEGVQAFLEKRRPKWTDA